MAVKVGEAFVEINTRMDKYNTGLKDAQRKLKGFETASVQSTRNISTSFTSMAKGAIVAFAVFRTGQVILNKFVKAASDAEEINNKFSVTFRDVSEEAKKASLALAKNYGIAKAESQKLLANTGDLLTGFEFTGAEALELSVKTNQLALDLASLNSATVTQEQASNALTKALIGERESIKTLGIAILEEDVKARVAAKGQENLTGIALRQAKAIATLELAYEQSKNAIGDFARSQNSYANVQKRSNAILQDFAVIIGTPLKNALNEMQLNFVNNRESIEELVEAFAILIAVIIKAIGWVIKFGKYITPITALIKLSVWQIKKMGQGLKALGVDLGDTSNAVDKTSKALEKQKQAATRASKAWLKLRAEARAFIKNVLESIETPEERIRRLQEESLKNLDEYYKKKLISEKQFQEAKRIITEDADKAIRKTRLEVAEEYIEATMETFAALNEVFNVNAQNRIQEIDQERNKKLKQLNDTFNTEKDNILKSTKNKKKADKAIAKLEVEKAKKEADINEKADKEKNKIAVKAFRRQQAMDAVQAAIKTALAVITAMTTMGPPASFVFAALSAATGAASIAAILSQKPPAMADGGIVTGSTLAQIGEAGDEAVFPLEGARGRKTRQMFAEDLISAIGMQADRSGERLGTVEAEEQATYNITFQMGTERFFSTITKAVSDRNILIDERAVVRI